MDDPELLHPRFVALRDESPSARVEADGAGPASPRARARRRASAALFARAAVCATACTAVCATGCVSSSEPGAAAPEGAEAATGPEGPGVVDYAMILPENVVYLPWKLIGGGLRGASDGVQAGFDGGRMPVAGALFIPINLVAGFVTGVVEGAMLSPAAVGPSDDFGRAIEGPTKHATTIWWYPD